MSAAQIVDNKKALTKTVRTLLAEASSGDTEVDPVHRIARAHAFVDCALIFKVVPLAIYDVLKKEILDTVADHRNMSLQSARSFKRLEK